MNIGRCRPSGVESCAMPLKLRRWLIAMALTLTVPIQGLAASVGEVCLALGHQETQQAGHQHNHHQMVDHHAHGAESSAGHHMDENRSSGSTHCPPCAACCATAAIAFFTPAFAMEQRAESAVAAPAASFSGVAPERLDRPPQHFLA